MMAIPAMVSAQTLASANFATYTRNAELVGQNGWVQIGTNATNPIPVSASGVVALPGGPAVDGQDAVLPFTETILPPAEGVTTLRFDAVINVTFAGANPSYFLALQGGTFQNARIAARALGSGYQLGVRVTGQSGYPFVYGTQEFPYGTLVHIRAIVHMVAGAANDEIELYASTNPQQLVLQGVSKFLTGSTPTDPTDYNGVIISQFGSGTVQQSGVAISSLSVSRVVATSIENGNETASKFTLEQNYPNPFNPSTAIRFTLDAGRQTRLSVYDLLGREVAVLVNGTLPAGAHTVTFDASNLPSGVYMYKLEAGGQSMTKRMTLVK